MTTRRVCAFILLAVGLLQAQSAWVVDSLQRVGVTDAAGATTSIALYAAKGEYESFQVIVHAPASSLTITGLTASNLTGPGGTTISQQDFTFYREYYVNVTTPSPNFGGTNQPLGAGWYPDALIPFKDPSTGQALNGTYQAVPYTLAANHNQPYWIDINVPRTAVAGNYSGTVTVSTSLGTFTIPITLQVWNFTLPVAPRLKANFGFHTTWGNLPNNEVMLENRVGPFIISVDQVAALKPYGAEITGLNYFNQSSGCAIETPPSVAALTAAVAQYAGFPTYVYAADEVGGCSNLAQNLRLWAQVAHAAGTKTLVTVIPQAALLDDGTGTGRTDVDIWTILPKQYAAALPELPAILAKGNELWSYTALVQETYSPKWELDFAPINYRISPGFINQQFGFTGMLYSSTNRWTSDPWNNVNTFQIPPYNYPCEGLLVYPGQQVGMSPTSVVPSMRLKYLRDGFDDYDYLALLKDQGDSAFADSIVNSIAPDWINWTRSTATLLNARIQLGNELDRLGNGSTQQVATPTFSVAGGTYTTAQMVAISSTTTGSSIRYTTDGSTPSSTVGTVYSSPITVSSSMTVKAIGYMSGWTNSAVSSVAYTINVAPPPDFTIGMAAGPGTVVAGASPTYTVTITGNNGFSGVASFGVAGLPPGVTGAFNPTTVSGSGSTTLTLSTTGAALSSFTIMVTGTSGALQHNTTAALTITGVSAGPPAPASVSPSSGTGPSQTFAFTLTDPNGATDITFARVDINAAFDVANACYLLYVRGSNAVDLANDAGVWQGPVTLGSPSTLQNSQCSVSAAGSWATPSGNTLTLNLALTFQPAFAGAKNVYMKVQNASLDSGWSLEGNWTVASAAPSPDFSIDITAGPGTVAAGASPTYTVTGTGNNGFAGVMGFGVSGLPSGVTGCFNPTPATCRPQ